MKEEDINHILVWIDVGPHIKVRGNGGFSCEWNSLTLHPQKVDLINGKPTPQSVDLKSGRPTRRNLHMRKPVPGEAMIVGAEFSIAADDQRKIITQAVNKTMNTAHRRIIEIVTQEWEQQGQ